MLLEKLDFNELNFAKNKKAKQLSCQKSCQEDTGLKVAKNFQANQENDAMKINHEVQSTDTNWKRINFGWCTAWWLKISLDITCWNNARDWKDEVQEDSWPGDTVDLDITTVEAADAREGIARITIYGRHLRKDGIYLCQN